MTALHARRTPLDMSHLVHGLPTGTGVFSLGTAVAYAPIVALFGAAVNQPDPNLQLWLGFLTACVAGVVTWVKAGGKQKADRIAQLERDIEWLKQENGWLKSRYPTKDAGDGGVAPGFPAPGGDAAKV